DLARPSLMTIVVVLIAGLVIAIPRDVQWSRSRRHGRRLKGPELVSARQFNRRTRADGILFMQTPRWVSQLLGLQPALAIPRANENPFFTEGPRRIFAHLLTFRPTAEELASWLCRDDELDQRVLGTPYASIIDRQAPAQRSGVLAALNMVADTLKLLPRESQTTRRWSAESWARSRRGWLFLTSTPETRTRLVPLTSLWLDMLVLRLMNRGQPGSETRAAGCRPGRGRRSRRRGPDRRNARAALSGAARP